MGILIYGTKIVPIGVDEFFMRCPSCETHSPTDVMVMSRYYHFYWVPIAPIGKEANVICSKCGLKRLNLPFDSGLFSNFPEVRSKFKHPYFSYAGVILISIIIIAAILSSLGSK